MSPDDKIEKPSEDWDRTILDAREGSFSALGGLLDHYRPYLLRVAQDELPSELVAKVGHSDVVQETFLQAARDFPRFAGTTEEELRAWLRQILRHNARDAAKHFHGVQKRDVSREASLSVNGGESGHELSLAAPTRTPSSVLISLEQAVVIQAALGRLTDDHRRVIELRNFESRSFEEIGRILERSADAARKLWCRAIEKLAGELDANEYS